MSKQVVLEPQIHARAKVFAAKSGEFMNVIVNRAVDKFISHAERAASRAQQAKASEAKKKQ